MKSALLIGNGLNRTYEKQMSDISWKALMERISSKRDVTFYENNSFPIEFEAMVNEICAKQGMDSTEVIRKLKSDIADQTLAMKPQPGWIHEVFMTLPIREILTTNYDYMLEKTLVETRDIPVGSTEPKYSLNRRSSINGYNFHHIHGEAKKSDSLCLGYEHYAGYLSKLREYLKKAPSVKESLTGGSREEKSWADLFFTHDIHIVGLNLDVCEIDLWWLLNYRAYLYNLNPRIKNNLKNEIYFYYTSSDPVKPVCEDCPFAVIPQKCEDCPSRIRPWKGTSNVELFQRLHINCVEVKFDGADYEGAYRKIAQMIRDTAAARQDI